MQKNFINDTETHQEERVRVIT